MGTEHENKNEGIIVAGTIASGKSTYSAALAEQTGAKYIELDSLAWDPDWTRVPTPELQERVSAEIDGAKQGWILDGCYRLGEEVLKRASVFQVHNFSMRECMPRAYKRGVDDYLTGRPVCGENFVTLTKLIELVTVHPFYQLYGRQVNLAIAKGFESLGPPGTKTSAILTSFNEVEEWTRLRYPPPTDN